MYGFQLARRNRKFRDSESRKRAAWDPKLAASVRRNENGKNGRNLAIVVEVTSNAKKKSHSSFRVQSIYAIKNF